MVEVPDGLFPVDAQGVLLPSGDFTAAEARNYPRIAGVPGQPLGLVGSPWNDAIVTAAAKIADELTPIWKDLGLYQIRPLAAPQQTHTANGDFELVTRNGLTITWGSAPGHEQPGEPTTSEKIARLRKRLAKSGSVGEATITDLRLAK
jgi:hypothetical protein